MANYAASKAYVLHLAEALNIELAQHGVDVLALSPGPTRTPMTDAEGMDFDAVPMAWMTPAAVSMAGLEALGQRASVIPGVLNNVMGSLFKRALTRRAGSAMFGTMMGKASVAGGGDLAALHEPERAAGPTLSALHPAVKSA